MYVMSLFLVESSHHSDSTLEGCAFRIYLVTLIRRLELGEIAG